MEFTKDSVPRLGFIKRVVFLDIITLMIFLFMTLIAFLVLILIVFLISTLDNIPDFNQNNIPTGIPTDWFRYYKSPEPPKHNKLDLYWQS